ncbi:MAG: hypothetical protein AAGN64_00240 [Bacteroidota bacterium]
MTDPEPRVFLDANILFSAACQGSVVDQLVERLTAVAAVVSCDHTIEEARRNVAVKRPAWADHLEAWVGRIEAVPTIIFKLPVELAEKDVPVMCSAIRGGCDLLATSDARDFGHLFDTELHGVRVLSLANLAEWLLEMEARAGLGG